MEQASQIENQYKAGLNYKKQIGFNSVLAECERMYAGDQWPKPTERTKLLPRPVFNIVSRIIDHKVASVMNENVKIVFRPQDAIEDESYVNSSDIFTRYSDTLWENIKQDDLNEQVLLTAGITGTGIWHYYWDSTIEGGNSLKYLGEIQGEEIDPINFFPANPQQRDIQKQPYNIITTRDTVRNIRKEAERNGLSPELIQQIKSDKDTIDDYQMAKIEVDDEDKLTIIIKYWKEDNVIWHCKVASGIVFKPATATKLTRYPIAVISWKKRKKSIFGVGDAQAIIPNQKAINLISAMQLLAIQNVGWPKQLINSKYLQSNVTNTPGEVINHTAPPGERPIEYLNPPQIPGYIQGLIDSFMTYTKDTAGANENALGEQFSSQMNATAIMQLQKAAGVPLESIRRSLYKAIEDIGRIWEDFYKNYYNTDRSVVLKDDNGEEYTEQFNGETYKDFGFNLKVDIGPSSSYSEAMMMTSLDRFLDKNLITFKDYLIYVPKNVVPFKDRLLRQIEEQEELQRQQAELDAQAQVQMQQEALMQQGAPPQQQPIM